MSPGVAPGSVAMMVLLRTKIVSLAFSAVAQTPPAATFTSEIMSKPSISTPLAVTVTSGTVALPVVGAMIAPGPRKPACVNALKPLFGPRSRVSAVLIVIFSS